MSLPVGRTAHRATAAEATARPRRSLAGRRGLAPPLHHAIAPPPPQHLTYLGASGTQRPGSVDPASASASGRTATHPHAANTADLLTATGCASQLPTAPIPTRCHAQPLGLTPGAVSQHRNRRADAGGLLTSPVAAAAAGGNPGPGPTSSAPPSSSSPGSPSSSSSSAAAAVATPAATASMTWRVCGGGPPGSPMLAPDSVTLAPDPPHHGRHMAVNVTGTSPVSTPGGRLRVAVAYLGVKVYTYDSALCDAMPCPLEAGAPFLLRVSQKLPALAPPGPYTMEITGEDAAGSRFMCVAISFRVTLPTRQGLTGPVEPMSGSESEGQGQGQAREGGERPEGMETGSESDAGGSGSSDGEGTARRPGWRLPGW